MSKRTNPELIDSDNPEWTEADIAKAVRIDALPASLQANLKSRGRPKADVTKQAVTVRYDPDVLEAFKSAGPGWQSRMNDALRDYAKKHKML